MATAKSVDPAVYEAYLQGRYWGGKFRQDDLLKAKGYYERAVVLDPAFAPAWAGLADALNWISRYYGTLEPTISEAEAAARRALQLDEGLADAHAALAHVALARWQWQSAEEQIRRAIALDPNSARAHHSYWRLLAPQRRFEEAHREIELASKLDPLSAQVAAALGIELVFEERFAEAERTLRHALELDPDFQLSHGWLWLLYARTGKDPERGEELAFYMAAMNHPEVVAEYRNRLAADGYAQALDWAAHRISAGAAGNAGEVGLVAGLLAEAGDTAAAIEFLQLGLDHHVWEMPWLAVTPDYRNLYGLPGYTAILDRLGLPHPTR